MWYPEHLPDLLRCSSRTRKFLGVFRAHPGIRGSGAQSGTNFPILSAIVPAESRSRVMAWECALENSIANALGPPVVSLLATHAFGYRFGEEEQSGDSLESAKALGQAMSAVICLPWLVCFCAYSLLHWSYPRDVRRLSGAAIKKTVKASSEGEVEEKGHVGGDDDEIVARL